MTEMLLSLSANQLQALAGEIARALDGTGTSRPQAEQSPLLSLLGALSSSRQEELLRQIGLAFGEEVRGEVSAGGHVQEEQTEAATDLPVLTTAAVALPEKQAEASRFSRQAADSSAPDSLFRSEKQRQVPRQELAELSDFFRRDSRRYDAGFERY